MINVSMAVEALHWDVEPTRVSKSVPLDGKTL